VKRTLLILMFGLGPSTAALAEPDRVVEARTLTTALQQQLGAALKQAIASGGPQAAIEVCQVRAPEIAASLSSDATVGRTALRVRNPDNAPDAGAREVMTAFATRIDDGEQGGLEHFEQRADGSARYMRAIITQPMCELCHGASLASGIAEELALRYPRDAATGFRAGELRGAFIVDWPEDAP